MADALKSILASIDELTTQEKAVAAHKLLVALDDHAQDHSDQQWYELAQQRLREVKEGTVETVAWTDLKHRLRRKPGYWQYRQQ